MVLMKGKCNCDHRYNHTTKQFKEGEPNRRRHSKRACTQQQKQTWCGTLHATFVTIMAGCIQKPAAIELTVKGCNPVRGRAHTRTMLHTNALFHFGTNAKQASQQPFSAPVQNQVMTSTRKSIRDVQLNKTAIWQPCVRIRA